MKLRFYCAFFLLGTALLAQDKPKETPPVIQPATESEFNPAQLKLDPAVSRIIGDFFLSLRKKQIDEAYDVLTKGSKIADKPGDVATLKKQTKKAVEIFGEIDGYEAVQVHPVGTRLLRLTCLSFNKDLPLRWRFYFYRSESEWKLVDLGVDDRLVDLFDENQQAAPRSGASHP